MPNNSPVKGFKSLNPPTKTEQGSAPVSPAQNPQFINPVKNSTGSFQSSPDTKAHYPGKPQIADQPVPENNNTPAASSSIDFPNQTASMDWSKSKTIKRTRAGSKYVGGNNALENLVYSLGYRTINTQITFNNQAGLAQTISSLGASAVSKRNIPHSNLQLYHDKGAEVLVFSLKIQGSKNKVSTILRLQPLKDDLQLTIQHYELHATQVLLMRIMASFLVLFFFPLLIRNSWVGLIPLFAGLIIFFLYLPFLTNSPNRQASQAFFRITMESLSDALGKCGLKMPPQQEIEF